MENKLTSLGIDWEKAQPPLEDVTASVIYLNEYITFSMYKECSIEGGDMYRVIMPNRVLKLPHRLLLNKLASSGLKFKLGSSEEMYMIEPRESRERIENERNQMYVLEGLEELEEEGEEAVDEAMYETAEEGINNYRNGENPSEEFFEIGIYFKYWNTITENHFVIGDRWVNIGFIMLRIASMNIEESLSAIIMYNLNLIITRVGARADIRFIKEAKEFASSNVINTSNRVLERWNRTLLDTIESLNRIYYEI
jgi:hypothetical protein